MDRLPAVATWTFGALLVAGVAIYAVAGRSQWFFQDEWVFFSTRDGGSLHGLFAPHNEHWTTLPVIAYRVLWNTVGVHSYKPYQAMTIGLHLVVVVLVHTVMRRRLGVSPWIATLSAGVLLLYGSGSENVLWAFQITFLGSLALGLAHLLLADHPSPSPGRRVRALACGLGALMCSGVGVIMVLVVGLAVLARHGWRAAASAVAPLAAVVVVYRLLVEVQAGTPTSDLGLVARFASTGISFALTALSGRGWLAVVLGAVVVVGLGLVAIEPPRTFATLRTRLGIPAALVLGVVAFFVLTGLTRAANQGIDFATRGRYAYAAVALLVPVIALGADAVVHRWRWATVPVVVLLIAGVPANLRAIEPRANRDAPPALVLAVANSADIDDVPADLLPFEGITGYRVLTAGWLRDQVAAGRIPRPDRGAVGPDNAAEATARLGLRTAPNTGQPLPGPLMGASATCQVLEPAPAEQIVRVASGQAIGFIGEVQVVVLHEPSGRSRPRVVGSFKPRALATTGIPLVLAVSAVTDTKLAGICR